MTAVFVSHASQDKEAAAKLCADLQEAGIDTWASFKDIQPGEVWNKTIEEALGAATHVIVVASQSSIASDYVRAEVEWALDNGKTVIPALIEQVKLPLRWHTLQYADLSKPGNQAVWQSLVDRLPKNTLVLFDKLLEAAALDPIRAFLWKRPSIFGHSVVSHSAISQLTPDNQSAAPQGRFDASPEATLGYIHQRNLMPVLGEVDFFEIQEKTVPSIRLIYLLEPTIPFYADGRQRPELVRALANAETVVTSPLLLKDYPGRSGLVATIELVAGRRDDWQSGLDHRLALEEEWASSERQHAMREKLSIGLGQTSVHYRTDVRFMSYDQVLERI